MNKILMMAIVIALGIATEARLWAGITYPVDGDGSYKCNVTRHYDQNGVWTTSAAAANQVNCFVQQGTVAGVVDGSFGGMQWQINTFTNRANATASVRITLNRSFPINKIVTYFISYIAPSNYSLRVSDTGFASMTTVVNSNAVGVAYTRNDVFAPVTGRYIELTWYGGAFYDGTTSYAGMSEMFIYPQAALTGPLTTDDGYNILSAITPITTNDPSLGGVWNDAVGQLFDVNNDTYLRGNVAYSPNHARLVMDMGRKFIPKTLVFCCYGGQAWYDGGKVETSADGNTFDTVLDQIGAISGTLPMVIPVAKEVRYIRVTNYKSSWGAIEEFEVHAIPPPRGTMILGK